MGQQAESMMLVRMVLCSMCVLIIKYNGPNIQAYHPHNNTNGSAHWQSICLLVTQAIEASTIISADALIKQASTWNLMWRKILANYPHPIPEKRLDATVVSSMAVATQYRQIYLVSGVLSSNSQY
jgi:hypothetical protein